MYQTIAILRIKRIVFKNRFNTIYYCLRRIFMEVRTFRLTCRPDDGMKATTSVNVPPISTPIANDAMSAVSLAQIDYLRLGGTSTQTVFSSNSME